MTKNKQSGSVLIIGLIVALVLVGGVTAVYLMNRTPGIENNDDASITLTQTNEASAESNEQTQRAPTEAKSLPDGYPSDAAPIYEPSTIILASNMGVAGWLVSIETNDDIDTVAKSIAHDYEALGGKVIQDPLNDEGVGQIVVSLGGYGTAITYNTDTEKGVTSISYSVSQQRQR